VSPRGGGIEVTMNETDLVNEWLKFEEQFSIQGWDFSHIQGMWNCPNPPWNYQSLIRTYLKDSDILLDMGTGGGEVLLSIGHPGKNTYVTEAYVPNFELCKKTLSPFGITVAQTFTDDKLPFDNETFDFIINRHESFDLAEVNRVLKHGGYFITQQVGNQNSVDLIKRFIKDFDPHNSHHKIGNYTDTLVQLGFQIIATDEIIYPVKFFDVNAFIFYAKACVWEFPDFSVEKNIDTLMEYQKEIYTSGCFDGTGHRFMIASRKK